jgi:hypothetical protein
MTYTINSSGQLVLEFDIDPTAGYPAKVAQVGGHWKFTFN